MDNHRKNSGLWIGLLFILAAALIVLSQFGLLGGMSTWMLVVTAALFPVITISLIRRHFFGALVPAAFLIYFYRDLLGLPHLSLWPCLVAAVLLSIGLGLLFPSRWQAWRHDHPACDHGAAPAAGQTTDAAGAQGAHNPYERVEYADGAVVDCHVSFGSSAKYVNSQNLQRVNLSCSFGSIKLYLAGAQLDPAGATLNLDCSFGGIEIFLPHTWRVQNRASAFIGGIDCKDVPRYPGPEAPLLTLVGSVQFGGVEVKYI